MDKVTTNDIKGKLYIPPKDSHKGQNGKLLIIGGSHLFHAASLWALQVASRIVDMVHYCSVEENNELVMRLKEEFRNGIIVPRHDVEHYIEEDDAILIGPGMVRSEKSKIIRQLADQISKLQFKSQNLSEILEVQDEGEMTGTITNYLLQKYPHKQWVIDAGALQMVDPGLIPKNAILTPHKGEFERLEENCYIVKLLNCYPPKESIEKRVSDLSKKFNCNILLKGPIDIVCPPDGGCKIIEGGNAGMTKGGTGDVLAGLIAALACKNDPFLATVAGSLINKFAGDELYNKVGPYFNASDLAEQIPMTLKKLM